MDGLLPGCGVQEGVYLHGRPHVEAHLQVGELQPPEQAEDLDHPSDYGQFNPARLDRWVFGDRDSGAYLPKFAWTNIVRHYMVSGTASPDDPALAQYWADRHRRSTPPLDPRTLHLLQRQGGRCPLCGDYLLHADREPASPREWEEWLTGTRKAIARHNLAADGHVGTDDIRLVHSSCHRRDSGADARRNGTSAHLKRPLRLA